MIGKMLGQYKLLEEIGCGAMGVVYKAQQVSLNRHIALKVLLSHQAVNPTNLERFRREGATIARIEHPNIVQILDIGEDKGTHYIAMEFVEGQTVSQILKESGPFDFGEAVTVCAQLAAGLAAIQEQGLVHRDIKPSNIIIGKALLAKLADFGVAALGDQSESDRLTMTRATVGTPYYMSPEQVKARGPLDTRSDIYSLGVVLYEMLAGEHPFGDSTPTEAMMRQCHDTYPPIRRYRQDIPDDLEILLKRCMEKDRSDRYTDALSLYKSLERIKLRLDMLAIQENQRTAEYRARTTGTNFFYVDSEQERQAKQAAWLKNLFTEMVAQITDPNKKTRRQLEKRYKQLVLSRAVYKKHEEQLEKLGKRRTYHDQKSTTYKKESEEQIAAGETELAEIAATNEARHEKLALDYAHQCRESGKQVERLRNAYDRIRQEYTEAADTLALRDAEARRTGKAIPGHDNPKQTRAARTLCYMAALLALALTGVGSVAAGKYVRTIYQRFEPISPPSTPFSEPQTPPPPPNISIPPAPDLTPGKPPRTTPGQPPKRK